jgi:hypothetical protein
MFQTTNGTIINGNEFQGYSAPQESNHTEVLRLWLIFGLNTTRFTDIADSCAKSAIQILLTNEKNWLKHKH